MATVWVIQVEVRENSLFFCFWVLSSLLFYLLLFLPLPVLFVTLLFLLPLIFSAFVPTVYLSPPPFPSHPLLFRFSVMLITERIRERVEGALIFTHWSLHNTERRERLTESHTLPRRCTHTHICTPHAGTHLCGFLCWAWLGLHSRPPSYTLQAWRWASACLQVYTHTQNYKTYHAQSLFICWCVIFRIFAKISGFLKFYSWSSITFKTYY